MVDPISLIVPDAGPLISLAMADQLALLDEFSVPIATLDVVKAECLYRDWPGRANLERWFGDNQSRLEIISSPFMQLYTQAMSVESPHQAPTATRGLGDASIAWFVANASLLRRRQTLTLVLTEDAPFGDGALGRNVHVLSTRAFLQTLEALDIVESAKDILDEVERQGRKVATLHGGQTCTRRRRQTQEEQLKGDPAQANLTDFQLASVGRRPAQFGRLAPASLAPDVSAACATTEAPSSRISATVSEAGSSSAFTDK